MRFNSRYIIPAVFSIAFFMSCEDNYTICDQSKQVAYKAGFYNKNGSVDVPVVPTALTLTFPGASTFIYQQQPGLAALQLSLNPLSDSIKYFIQLGNALQADTLTLLYSNTVQNLGPECGNISIHNLTGARTTTNTLDSVKIVASSVNNQIKENFKIYY